MSDEQPVVHPPAWPMYRSLVGVGLVCGLAIVSAFQFTKPIIAQNRLEAREAAVFRVLPGAVTSTTYALDGDGFQPAAADAVGDVVFAGYDDAGQLVGVAIEASGMGYQDVVRLLYGVDLDAQAIIGVQVLESRETPGLGTRVETDPEYLANFEALDVSVSGGVVVHPIEPVKHGTKTEPWQVDCITGATITSTAVGTILRDSSGVWMPRLDGKTSSFTSGAP